MSESECLKQSYNKRSRKWVLIDCAAKGGIKDMQPEKYEGIPVINGKPGSDEYKDPQESQQSDKESKPQKNEDNTAAEKREPQPPAGKEADTKGPDNNQDRKSRRFLW